MQPTATPGEHQDTLNYLEETGIDPNTEHGGVILAALKGKSKGKGKNSAENLACLAGGGEGHFARDCRHHSQDTALQVPKGKGKGKGKGNGKGKYGAQGSTPPTSVNGYDGRGYAAKGRSMSNLNTDAAILGQPDMGKPKASNGNQQLYHCNAQCCV